MIAPLSGVTVLDLTRNLAGPYSTMVLGDLGARVIKVERPGFGDDTRQWTPPTWGDHSALFLALNRNKESVVADIDSDAGAQAIRDLAARADVIVESNRTGSLDKRGLGFAASARSIQASSTARSVASVVGGRTVTGPDMTRSCRRHPAS